jgi:hypothetical protein
MADGNLVRLGGVFGLLAVVANIPGYLVGYPAAASSLLAGDGSYLDAGLGTFVFANGVLPLFHSLFFILFLGVLYGMLRHAQDSVQRGLGLPAAALVGGIVFVGLQAAGFAAEIVYPATLLGFEGFVSDERFGLVSVTLAFWLFHFCQVGTSALVLVTSLVALGTGVLPRWLALAGFVVALLTLLHFLLPLLGALAGLVWVAVVSLLMLTGGVGSTGGGPRRQAMRR